MKKRVVSILAAAVLAGCGGSGGGLGQDFNANEQGNFISSTVEVEQRYLYVLNSDSTVSGYVFPAEAEEEGHDHAHGRILAQEEEEHEGPEPVELDPSPFQLDHNPIGMGLIGDTFLVTLDAAGVVRTFEINGANGLFEESVESFTNVPNPRRLIVTEDGLAVLGDNLHIYTVDSNGALSAPAFVPDTDDWVDVKLDGELAAASTPSGAVGFAWQTGSTVSTVFEVALPGATRGELAYAEEGLFVLNTDDGSVSRLSQDDSGELALEDTFDLGTELANPTLITGLFDGVDLMIADEDSVGLFHPEDGELENEGEAELERVPVTLFQLPESEAVFAGHADGEGSTTILIEEDSDEVLEVSEEPGPGGAGPTAFGYAERFEAVTVTTGFE
ncbi:MAG: hypothetical protein KC800_14545 [Candidatus Eremiobacteraeota bacterium]|nr:hypothetical protein [Candidatus Eremiobacteraeota bacterium]